MGDADQPPQLTKRARRMEPPSGDLLGRCVEFSELSPVDQKSGLVELLKQLQAADAARICALLDGIDIRRKENDKVVFAAMFALSQKDPAAYLRYACSLNKESRLLELNSVLRNLIATDTNTVLRWLQDEPHESESARILAASLRRNLLEVRPQLGLSLAQPSGGGNQSEMLNGYRHWGGQDPETALAKAQGSLQGDELAAAVRAIMEGATSKDPAEAFRLIDQIGSVLRENARMIVLTGWFETDPAKAVNAITGLPDATVRSFLSAQPQRMAEIMSRLPDTGFKILAGMKLSQETRAIFRAASDSLAAVDPLKALDWLKGFSDSPQRNEILESAYRKWATADPANAERSILSISDSSRNGALRGLAAALVQRDPKSAAVVAPRLPSAERPLYLASVLDAMVSQSAAARSAVLGDPVFGTEILQSPEIAGRVERIAMDYAKQSPDDGKAWIGSLDETCRPAAVSGLMTTWLKSDLLGATAWLQTLDAGKSRDAGIRALIAEIKTTDPESAAKWDASLGEHQKEQP